MILVPMVLVGIYTAWHIYNEHTRVEAARQFAQIEYRAHGPNRKRH